jgi:hypothetical protein
MEIVSDDDNDSLFDTIVIVHQESSSDNSSDKVDKETFHLFVWGSRQGRVLNVEGQCAFYSHLLFQDFLGPIPVSHTTTSNLFKFPIKFFVKVLVRVLQHNDFFKRQMLHAR